MTSPRIRCQYIIESPTDIWKAAEILASEQSIGSFTKVVGETDDVIRRCGASVDDLVILDDRTAASLSTSLPGLSAAPACTRARATISFPVDNFAPNVPCLFAILLGNLFELQELTGVRLEDVSLPPAFSAKFPGPAFGVSGTRQLAGIGDGPLIGTIVKPKLGLSPAEIAELAESLGNAGIHFLKDDECMTDPPLAPLTKRIEVVMAALNRVADRVGRKPMFAFNISGDGDHMRRGHDLVAAHGGTCVMVSLNACGPSAISELRRHSTLPIHAHRAGWGMLTRHPALGIEFAAYEKLWRLAGVDQIHVGGLQSKFFEDDSSVVTSARACLEPLDDHRPIMPVFSSGQWGGQAPETFRQVGSEDVIYLAGGGILGHPLGPEAGVEALREAWEAARLGIELDEYAVDHPALAASIRQFSNIRANRGGVAVRKSKPTLCFYGDDFTGSTDALDALASAGIEAALLLDPSTEILDMVPEVAAIGIAGMSRAMTPDEMEGELPVAFDFLAALNPQIIHYKVCSTFDSSPSKGNIGKAMELGRRSFGSGSIPVVVGSPALGRYVAFGNLFARAGNAEVHRLDRHPVMSRHPITPMLEADLRLHLANQTTMSIDLVTLTDVDAERMPSINEREDVILFDTTTVAHLQNIGRWLIKNSRETPIFCVGSSAIETAIAPQLRSTSETSTIHRIASGERPVAIVSGSCSPITARQIDVAIEHGFSPIYIPAMQFADDRLASATHDEAVSTACAELERGNSPIIFSAHGSGDLDTTIDGHTRPSIERQIGERLGAILQAIVERAELKKVIVAGGDTSGSVTRALGLSVLQVAAPIAPGAPLCLGTRRDRSRVEIALKGGQIGGEDFFLRARAA